MDQVLLDLASKLTGSGYFQPLVILLAAGAGILLLNVLTQAFVEHFKERAGRRNLVERHLRPVIDAADRLISRISDILITYQLKMRQLRLACVLPSPPEHLAKLSPLSINRFESTAFRLLRFLAIAEYFSRNTIDIPGFRLLDRARYFLNHKIPVGLRGHLFQSTMLRTEVQEEMATRMLDIEPQMRAWDLSVGKFCSAVTSGRFDPSLFDTAQQVFTVDTALLASQQEISRGKPEWRHLLNLAQLAVYLIDFSQELGRASTWEEQRTFLVRLIVQWNGDSVKPRYFYEPGDLETRNYLDTYPGRVLPAGALATIFGRIGEALHLSRPVGRFVIYCKLNIRGGRFRRRHDTKAIRKWGIKIRTPDGWQRLRLRDKLYALYADVGRYAQRRIVD